MMTSNQDYRLRASSVVLHQEQILSFQARDPSDGRVYLFLPGGGVEAGETIADAARRETKEETGYDIQLMDQQAPVIRRYSFYWNDRHHPCETYFFAAQLVAGPARQVEDASYHEGVSWVDLNQLAQNFGYHPSILTALLELLARWRQ